MCVRMEYQSIPYHTKHCMNEWWTLCWKTFKSHWQQWRERKMRTNAHTAFLKLFAYSCVAAHTYKITYTTYKQISMRKKCSICFKENDKKSLQQARKKKFVTQNKFLCWVSSNYFDAHRNGTDTQYDEHTRAAILTFCPQCLKV